MLRRAFDLGITHFDLANNYGPPYGSAEENFGRLLAAGPAPVPRRAGHLLQGRLRHVARPVRRRRLAQVPAVLARPVAGAARPGLRRHLLLAPPRPLGPARGDDGRAAHRRDQRPRAVRGHLELLAGATRGRRTQILASTWARRCSSTSRRTRCSTGTWSRWPTGRARPCWTSSATSASGPSCSPRSRRGCSPTATSSGDVPRRLPRGRRALPQADPALARRTCPARGRSTRSPSGRGQTLAQLALSWVLRDDRITSALVGASSAAAARGQRRRPVRAAADRRGDRHDRAPRGRRHREEGLVSIDDTDRTHLARAVVLAREALLDGDEPYGSVLVDATGCRAVRGPQPHQGRRPDPAPGVRDRPLGRQQPDPEERATATVYTSGEHCPMCSAAHAWVGLGRIVYATSSEQTGAWRASWGGSPGPVAAAADPGGRAGHPGRRAGAVARGRGQGAPAPSVRARDRHGLGAYASAPVTSSGRVVRSRQVSRGYGRGMTSPLVPSAVDGRRLERDRARARSVAAIVLRSMFTRPERVPVRVRTTTTSSAEPSYAGAATSASTASSPGPWRSSLAAPIPLMPPSASSDVGRCDDHLTQRRVVEHHVGGHALLLGDARAPRPQGLEHGDALVGQVGRRGGLPARAA